MHLRRATTDDLQGLQNLMSELGYETSAATLMQQLPIYDQPTSILFVAETDNDRDTK